MVFVTEGTARGSNDMALLPTSRAFLAPLPFLAVLFQEALEHHLVRLLRRQEPDR